MYMTTQDNMLALPPGLESAGQQAPMPEARGDILDLERHREEHITRLLGIPMALGAGLNQGGSKFAKENIGDNDLNLLHRSIEHYQEVLIGVGTEVLQEMYEFSN